VGRLEGRILEELWVVLQWRKSKYIPGEKPLEYKSEKTLFSALNNSAQGARDYRHLGSFSDLT
jgi:hypothetical protein